MNKYLSVILETPLVFLVIIVWLIIKYIELVVKSWTIRPLDPLLILSTSLMLVMTVLSYLTMMRDLFLYPGLLISHLMLFLTCKVLELTYYE
jgi:hypothetical protein